MTALELFLSLFVERLEVTQQLLPEGLAAGVSHAGPDVQEAVALWRILQPVRRNVERLDRCAPRAVGLPLVEAVRDPRGV